jgi:hypothetical protein
MGCIFAKQKKKEIIADDDSDEDQYIFIYDNSLNSNRSIQICEESGDEKIHI